MIRFQTYYGEFKTWNEKHTFVVLKMCVYFLMIASHTQETEETCEHTC